MLEVISETIIYKFFLTMGLSMVPVLELRAGIPFGMALGLNYSSALAASIIGNMLPIPFIILFLRKTLDWLVIKSEKFGALRNKLENIAYKKGEIVDKYKIIGLTIFVAIPLPGTGAWTGALIAAFLDIRMKNALPAIGLGVLIAGIIVSAVSYKVFDLLG